MGVDTLRPALGAQAVAPKQGANGESGRDSRRDGKPAKPEQEQPKRPRLVLNSLGQATGTIIDITA
ncbi:MAG: hypothetical protein A3H93_18620 [Rhodocyclales bacterium RIFCSPLOWO2_02_FULL_63_24]|nr:MAG: hypothetical protein A3H93_18620 [Rhodocyclales bacterium RIFCSPLOWO2_02_FULL_63_24]